MKYTYQRLVELVDGDEELVAGLVEQGEIRQLDDDRALVDVERVLVARTLHRELEIDWNGVEVILRLRDELAAARTRIAELEAALARGPK
ncbi:MAG: hypothetical protein ABI678_29985 [Kofleriaceae bacterium]